MVLKEDLREQYTFRLTLWRKDQKDLKHATDMFENDTGRNCIIKLGANGMYAVFTDGNFYNDGYEHEGGKDEVDEGRE